jgi:FMN phosphatase YigB (HAD superfamily)
MVGDTLEADILGAIRAGIHSVWIGSREDARQEGRDPVGARVLQAFRPDATISRLEELPGCLHELERRSGGSL